MSNFRQLDQSIPKVIIDNEDDSFNTFIRLLVKSGLFEEGKNIHQLRCKKAPPKPTIGNRLKKI
jgi:pentatricopeptide repeat protein